MRPWHAWVAAAALCAGCDGESVEATPVEVPVRLGSAPGPVVTDLGYTVRLTAARQVITHPVFTRGGEAHAARPWWGWLVGTAHAHPGHSAGGEARGELPGRFVVDWLAVDTSLGSASILPGALDGADFGLGTAGADDVAGDDPLAGYNLYLEAEVSRGDETWTLTMRVPQDADEGVTGAPCLAEITEGAAPTLRLTLRVLDPFEGDTVWDGIDFAAVDDDGDGYIEPGPEATTTNRVRRALQTHDHYEVISEERTM